MPTSSSSLRDPARPQPPDARAWERVTPKHPVLVSTVDDRQRVSRGGVLNISGGGLGCFLSGPPIPQGSDVLARLNLRGSGHRVFKVLARVAWTRPHETEGATRYGLAWHEGTELQGVREAISSLA